MARKSDIPGRVIEAALELAAIQGWRRTSISEIAAEAGLDLARVRAAFPSKTSIVAEFVKRIDDKILADAAAPGGRGKSGGKSGGKASAEADESTRDRLFDVLMRRFDALTPHKAGLAAIVRDTCADPLTAVVLIPRVLCSMAKMLEAAGVSSSGLFGALRVKGLAMIYAEAYRVWLGDDSKDMAKTMATLDRALGRVERLISLCRPGGRDEAEGTAREAAPG
jgi:AcrR family transcriptional regulator